MLDSPEATNGAGQPLKESLPEGLIEDKEKAVDMAYVGKSTREMAKRMEKVNPQVAAELQAKADQLEEHAGEQYDVETEYVNSKVLEVANMVVNFEAGVADKGYVRLEKDVTPTARERISHQFFGLFEGGIEARRSAQPDNSNALATAYIVDLPNGNTISESLYTQDGVTFFEINKTPAKLGIDG